MLMETIWVTCNEYYNRGGGVSIQHRLTALFIMYGKQFVENVPIDHQITPSLLYM